jgi:hypothetical protein
MLVGLAPAGNENVFHAFSEPDPERRPAAEPDPATLPDLGELEALDNRSGVVYVGPPLAELLAGGGQ